MSDGHPPTAPTEAASVASATAGARDEQIIEHTRQKDLRTMRGYVRRARLVSDSPDQAARPLKEGVLF